MVASVDRLVAYRLASFLRGGRMLTRFLTWLGIASFVMLVVGWGTHDPKARHYHARRRYADRQRRRREQGR